MTFFYFLFDSREENLQKSNDYFLTFCVCWWGGGDVRMSLSLSCVLMCEWLTKKNAKICFVFGSIFVLFQELKSCDSISFTTNRLGPNIEDTIFQSDGIFPLNLLHCRFSGSVVLSHHASKLICRKIICHF